jgi:phage tail-like protein
MLLRMGIQIMAKINPDFQHDMYRFIHKPIRVIDQQEGDQFVERFLTGPQIIFEDTQEKIKEILTLNDPSKIRADLLQYLKDHVGFTSELNNITNGLSENELRRLITLAVPLWKQKGTDPGYKNIVRLFTGKSSRIFNWFDFRLIVGEKAVGEEQLGEDSWFISKVGVEGSEDTVNNVKLLLTFEGNVKDRSLYKNDGLVEGSAFFYNTSGAFPNFSEKYVHLNGGSVTVENSSEYDLSGDFCFEVFYRSDFTENEKVLFKKQDVTGKGIKVTINKSTNEITFYLDDGVGNLTSSFNPGSDIDDGTLSHVAIQVNRTSDFVRLWYRGVDASTKEDISTLGDFTNNGKVFIGCSSPGVDELTGDYDNFRLALKDVYDVDSATITQPLSGFIEYQEEQLDEYFTDIRIVDDGTLNKILILRILNLMRPVSERINVIFISFFDDFFDGLGQWVTSTGSLTLTLEQNMRVEPETFVTTDVLNDNLFQDIVLQVKARILTGDEFDVIFYYQDSLNYYKLNINYSTLQMTLSKLVAGVETVIGSSVTVDIEENVDYIFTIETFTSESLETKINTYLDRNRIHSVTDSNFIMGKFGLKTYVSTQVLVGEVEMMEYKTDVQTIYPNFDL